MLNPTGCLLVVQRNYQMKKRLLSTAVLLTPFGLLVENVTGQDETKTAASEMQVDLPSPTLGAANKAGGAETASQRDARMKWWREARFGMFVHWGLYSVAGGKWEGRDADIIASWMQHKLRVSPQEYRKLTAGFTAENYDPAVWAKLAKTAGMKYAVLTAKHHEGFCLYDSKFTDYDVMATPAKRDLVKEYLDAFRKEGLKAGLYFSLIDWYHPDYPVKDDSLHPMRSNPNFTKQKRDIKKYIDFMHNQVRELVSNYGALDVMWWDFSYDKMTGEAWRAKELIKMVCDRQPRILMNNRLYSGVMNTNGDFSTPEQYVPPTGSPYDWETCMTMNKTWGYKPHDLNYKSSQQLIHTLIETVSKGGNYLLNVGPKPDGTIPEEQVRRLQDIGKWMSLHSESIYGTQASPFSENFSWGYCTRKILPNGNTRLYLHVLKRMNNGQLIIQRLGNKVIAARYLSDASKPELKCMTDNRGITLMLPPVAANPNAEVIVLDIQGAPEMILPRVFADAEGVIKLKAADAMLHGEQLQYPSGGGAQNSIGGWVDIKEWVSWKILTDGTKRYQVSVNYGLPIGHGGTMKMTVGDESLTFKTKPTGGWFERKSVVIGEVSLPIDTPLTLELKTLEKKGVAALDLHGIKLVPVSE